MNQSEQINELATALSKCQSELTFAVKDSNNPFHKSKYADLTSVWDSIRQPLTKNGLSVSQIVDINGDNTVLVSILMHTSGQWIRSCMPIINANKTAQGQGAGITYARRYALAALVGCVQDDDDAESAMPRDRGESKKKEKDISPIIDKEKRKILHALSEQCDKKYLNTVHSYMDTMGIKGLDNLTEDLYERVYKGLSDNASRNLKTA